MHQKLEPIAQFSYLAILDNRKAEMEKYPVPIEDLTHALGFNYQAKTWTIDPSLDPSLGTTENGIDPAQLPDDYKTFLSTIDTTTIQMPQILLKKAHAEEGFGIFAAQDIEPETLIAPYTGTILKKKNTSHRIYGIGLSRDFIIDAETTGNLTRYINHSYFPNSTGTLLIDKKSKKVQFWIKALALIKKNEEIRLNYGQDYWNALNKIPREPNGTILLHDSQHVLITQEQPEGSYILKYNNGLLTDSEGAIMTIAGKNLHFDAEPFYYNNQQFIFLINRTNNDKTILTLFQIDSAFKKLQHRPSMQDIPSTGNQHKDYLLHKALTDHVHILLKKAPK